MPLPELSDKKRAWYILQGYDIKVDMYGKRIWWLNGKRHREDGPAVEWPNGAKYWYLNDIYMTEDRHRIAIQKMRKERNNATS